MLLLLPLRCSQTLLDVLGCDCLFPTLTFTRLPRCLWLNSRLPFPLPSDCWLLDVDSVTTLLIARLTLTFPFTRLLWTLPLPAVAVPRFPLLRYLTQPSLHVRPLLAVTVDCGYSGYVVPVAVAGGPHILVPNLRCYGVDY